jgi:pimeloyl-ACP methyl ester carboxylesterase
MLKEQTFNTGVISINYAEGPPAGAPLVLLSGITGWWQTWLPIMPALSLRWHIYALDFRGHGKSDRVAGGYQWEAYAEDTISFLKERVGEPAILMGHSLGAMVTIQIAAQAPERVRAIVLEDPPLFSNKGARLRESGTYNRFLAWRDLARTNYSLETWLPALAGINPADTAVGLRYRARTLSLLDPDVLTQVLDGSGTEKHDIEAYLQQISCPALLLRGDPALGGAIQDRDVERLISLFPACLIVPMPEVGHGIHSQQPVEFSNVVSAFLETV